MTHKLRVQTVQFNASYGNQYYLPYSVGVLESYVRKFSENADNISFNTPLYRRADLTEIVETIGQVDVLAISCYVWNWRLSLATIAAVKAAHPQCFIIAGGPQVPVKDPNFMRDHPGIDAIVVGEGEESFLSLLESLLDNKDIAEIPGLCLRDPETGDMTFTDPRKRMRDLSELPSPYLDGTFDRLMRENNGHEWMAIWETNRGCPFSCTFCDWGSATNSKVVEMDWSRLQGEIAWFSDRKIRYIFGADANFGIRKRDREIAETLVAAKAAHGYPRDFRVCFTKNSTQKIFNIAKIFHDADMLRGVSLSMQSLHAPTLETIKRSNIKAETFRDLQSHYNAEGVATYTELIMALPGESYESFVAGIDQLLERGQHSQIIIYNCTVMPNAEMGDPAYREKHEIDTVEIPIFTAHASARNTEGAADLIEKEQIVVANRTLSRADWKKTYRFAWAVQCFHTLGLTQYLAIFMRHHYAVTYAEFYEGLLEFAEQNPDTTLGAEVTRLNALLDDVLAGIGFDQTVPGFGEIIWPAEEASLLRFSDDLEGLFAELHRFAQNLAGSDHDVLDAVLGLQRAVIVGCRDTQDLTIDAPADIYGFITAARIGRPAALNYRNTSYKIRRAFDFAGDRERFAREIVWYGRKGGKFLYPVETKHKALADVA